jgi:hypothetical protein
LNPDPCRLDSLRVFPLAEVVDLQRVAETVRLPLQVGPFPREDEAMIAFQIADVFGVPLDEVFQYGNSTRSRT